jgi:hypothetical protein
VGLERGLLSLVTQAVFTSVHTQTTQELLDGFSLNLILGNLLKYFNFNSDQTIFVTMLHDDLHLLQRISH